MKRRIQGYCVGTGRCGTTSLAGIFSSGYKVAHEPNRKELATIILALQRGRITRHDFSRYVIHLDNQLQLEFNSSAFNSWLLDVLVKEFPEAKFVFAIRDCYSWLNSFLDHIIFHNRLSFKEYKIFFDAVMGKGVYQYAPEERIFCEKGVYTLDGFLSYWARVNHEIISKVPCSRILVVRTHEISSSMDRIADFFNIPAETLDPAKSHLYQSVKSSDILSQIDRDYLLSKIDLHCKDLMDKFFPDFKYPF